MVGVGVGGKFPVASRSLGSRLGFIGSLISGDHGICIVSTTCWGLGHFPNGFKCRGLAYLVKPAGTWEASELLS